MRGPAYFRSGQEVHAPVIRDRDALLVAQLEAELPLEVVEAAQERGRARDLEATVAELLIDLETAARGG